MSVRAITCCFRKYSSQDKTQKFFTTPIYYVNSSPHIGHLYSSLIADAAQRWQKVFDKNEVILFSTGSDEHGSKIQQAANKNNTSPATYCKNISSQFKKLADDFKVGYTDFIRTTSNEHKSTVELLWANLVKNNHIYLSNYEGWYCVQDETFLSESQLIKCSETDAQNVYVSAESGHPVEWTKEENYMFRLSQFGDELVYWLQRDENVVRPKKFHKILLDLVQNTEEGLKDLSVSRPSSRVQWGISVPDDPTQTVYVWLDALANYLTVAGYSKGENFNKNWPPDIQVIGKDILKFHGIYWPAFLLAANLEPPRSLLCHSHWTVEGEKMSKSKGNVVCPFDMAKTYTTDGVRYFLLREGVAHSDGNYSDQKVMRILNSELADTLGNLLSRCCGSALNPAQQFPKIEPSAFKTISASDSTKQLIDSVTALPNICRSHYENLNFYKVADSVIATLHLANLFFETMKPWELKKNPNAKNELDVVLHLTLETLRVVGILLQPIVPDISDKLLGKMNVLKENRHFSDLQKFSWEKNDFEDKHLSTEKIILFKRILAEEDKKLQTKKQ